MELETIKQIIKSRSISILQTFTMDTTFEDLQIDSLDMAEIVMDIEDHFDVIIDSNQNLKSIGDLVKLCQK